jgi:tetratricopeptide (TPR) repeat protein
VLALVEALPPDPYGWASVEYNAFRQRQNPFLRRIDDELTWLKASPVSPAVRDYVVMAVDCDYRFRGGPTQRERPIGSRPALPEGAAPLVAFRHGICVDFQHAALEKLRAGIPRFVETSYYAGRLAVAQLQQTGDTGKAREPVTDFYRRFPTSSSATYLMGAFNQHLGDCREALRYYDETIVLKPIHENAWLGRTLCLTFLKRNDEAIQSATRMIELNMPNASSAYYWRAWNRHFLKQLPEARADIDQAKRMRASSEIYTLAGMIEHDQDDLPPAQADLQMARSMSDGKQNCEAGWYLGLVFMKKAEWTAAGAEFESTMDCYRLRLADNEAARKAVEAKPDLDPEFKARQLANFDAVVRESASQRAAGAYNAAHFYARGGEVEKAKALLVIAAEDPALAARVAELRKLIGGGG